MATSVLMFSVTEVFIKALGDRYSLIEIVAFRIWLSLPIILVALASDRRRIRLRTKVPLIHALRFVLGLTSMIAIYYAISTIPLGTAAALTSTSPFFVLAGSSYFLAEPVPRSGWLGTAIGFLGVVLVATPRLHADPTGIVIAVAGAALTAGVILCLRVLGRTETAAVSALYNTIGMSMACLAAGPYLDYRSALSHDGLLVAGLGTAGGFAQILNTLAYRHGAAARLAPLEFTACLWGPLLGYVLWGERVAPVAVIGMLAIVSGGFLCSVRGERA
jgi:drug/metabolite transporter (DMT)-like permease